MSTIIKMVLTIISHILLFSDHHLLPFPSIHLFFVPFPLTHDQ